MTEIIRYSRLGKEDCRFGTGTFEVRLADGRVVTIGEIDIGALLNDADNSTQDLDLGTVSVTNLTVSAALTIGSAGILGLLTLATGQINFPSTQNPSANAHTLDDYEEGTWTPSVGGTASYTTQSGTYVKIGQLVFVTCELVIATIGTGSTAVISGLPFQCEAVGALSVGFFQALAASVVSLNARVLNAQSVIYLVSLTAAGVANASNAVLGNSARVELSGCYVTS